MSSSSNLRKPSFLFVAVFPAILAPISIYADTWNTGLVDGIVPTATSTRLGIGVSSTPAYPLQVVGSSNTATIAWKRDISPKTWGMAIDNYGNYLSNVTDNIIGMSWLNDGKVGIGTSPAYPLHIVGAGAVATIAWKRDVSPKTWGMGVDNSGNYLYNITDNKMAAGWTNDGKMGIGTPPSYPLHIIGAGSVATLAWKRDVSPKTWGMGVDNSGNYLSNLTDNVTAMAWLNNGKVGIGTTIPAEKLEVAGAVKAVDLIATNSIKIKNWTIDAPDYVFETGYKVRPLPEVERLIRSQKHLPDMPSAKEFKEHGMDIMEMNYKLLQKVEELTLYAIEQDKRIKKLESSSRKTK